MYGVNPGEPDLINSKPIYKKPVQKVILEKSKPIEKLEPVVEVKKPEQQYRLEPYTIKYREMNAPVRNMDGVIETPNSGHEVTKTFMRRVAVKQSGGTFQPTKNQLDFFKLYQGPSLKPVEIVATPQTPKYRDDV